MSFKSSLPKLALPRIPVPRFFFVVRERFNRFNRAQKSFIVFSLVCAIVVVSLAIGLMNNKDGFSKLLIDPAYAKDNFDIEATKSDSIGVENTTEFLIKSKTAVDAQLLKQNIKVIPEVPFDFEKIADRNFLLTPKEPLFNRQVYKVQIAASYEVSEGVKQERDYSWAFQVKDEFKILQTLPRDKATGAALDTGIEITFSQDNYADYENAVTVEPKTDGRFEKHGRTLVFVPNNPLVAGTLYTVKVSKDLKLDGSEKRMADDYVFKFETNENGSMRGSTYDFNFEKEFSEFSVSSQPVFGVYNYGMNIDEIPVEVYAFSDKGKFIDALKAKGNVPYWARYSRDTYLQDVSGLSKVLSAKLPLSKYSYQEFFTLPQKLPRGYYIVQMQNGNIIRQSYLQVTDLAVYATATSTDTLVWVNDLDTKAPLAGASVESLLTAEKTETDANGTAQVPTYKFFGIDNGYNGDVYIKVTHGEFSTIVPFEIHYGQMDGSYSSAADNYWYYFYTDKSLYKPDDTVNYWGFVRSRTGQDIGKEIKVQLVKSDFYDYYYSPIVISESNAELKDGTVTGKIDLKNLTPGYYYLEFKSGDYVISTQYVSVQTYTKPAYDLQVAPEKYAIFAGENIVLNVQAKFFEGTPVSNLSVTYNQDQNPDAAVNTDGLGAAKITLPTAYSDCSAKEYCHYPGYSSIRLHPTKAEEGEISADTQVEIFGAKIKANSTFTQEGSDKAKITLKTNNVNLNKINSGEQASYYGEYLGNPAPGIQFKAELTEIDYVKEDAGTYYDFINKIVRKQYSYTAVNKPLGTYSGATDASGQFVYELPISLDKSYKVKIVATDSEGRNDMITNYLYTRSEGEEKPDYYTLQYKDNSRQNDYFSVGDNVELNFQNNDNLLPANGKKNFLYYKLQNGLLSYDVSQQPEYNFVFEDKYIPNIYVQGVWFDGSSYHKSAASSWDGSGKSIRFNSSDRKLDIKLQTDKDRYKPGEQVVLSAQVTDAKGRPVKASINLNLIDEAFYELSQESADTLAGLYNSSMSTGELASYSSHDLPVGMNGAERGGCFLAGTKIEMADGSEKNIEDVKTGDMIMTFENEYVKKLVPAKVAETFKHRVQEYLVINDRLKVTPQHRIFVNNGWEPIGDVKVGDYLVDSSGERVRIDSIKRVQDIVTVYNLHIEKYSTFIADGIYVHNDKDGGRENFVDNALFSSLNTDDQGKVQVSFILPDNITSWRVTAQGVGSQLYAGSNTAKIAVSLPVFVTSTFAEEYLASDKPLIKLNSFGEALSAGEEVQYQLDAPSLGINGLTMPGKAFEAQYAQLPQLTDGIHRITTGIVYKDYQDKMTKPIKVVDSRVTERQENFYDLVSGLKIKGSADGATTVVFSDKNRGQFYDMLSRLEWGYGDRVDQKLSRILAAEMKKEYFGEDDLPDSFDGSIYQLSDGGIALLPYGDSDAELSAKIASVAADHFDGDNLKSYFYGIYNDKNSTGEQVGEALYGLAGLGEPVLTPLQHFAAIQDLPVKTKIYAAMSLYELGDKEGAYKIYLGLMGQYAEHLDPYVRLKVSDNQDEVLADTTLMAILAGGLDDEYRDKLWQYASEHNGNEILTNMEELMYISQTMPNLKPGDAGFTFKTNEKGADVTLSKGSVYRIYLSPAELNVISFSNIKGNVGVTSIYDMPSSGRRTSKYVSASREYQVNGNKTDQFKENDLIEVVLMPQISKDAPAEDYQLTDILPSGLKAVTNPYSREKSYDSCIRYPFEIDGQKVKFYLGKSWLYSGTCSNVYKYYARVISLGQYDAEPAMVESMRVSGIKNYSNEGKINIQK